MSRLPSRVFLTAATFAASLLATTMGCSDRPVPAPGPKSRIGDFRVIKFAGEKVVVPFRGGLTTTPIPDSAAGEPPKAGDRVVLGDFGDGDSEVFLALDLVALQFFHSTPGPGELGRFRLLGDAGRLFVAPRGAVGTVVKVLDGELPEGLKAVELKLAGESGGTAWVGDPFVRRVAEPPR